MLRHTFCHVPGVGDETERSLWAQGCTDWDTYLCDPDAYSVGSASSEIVRLTLKASQEALEKREYQYFQKALAARETWRAWPDFKQNCAYLDIETDGGANSDSITTIGLYDGERFQCFIQGDNLENFRDAISHFAMIVTFFGTTFDLPMLTRGFRGLKFDQIHIDLCFVLKRLGHRGGLKSIERQVGITRSAATEGLTGRDAVRLWRMHRYGSGGALETLIAYNREDSVNLARLTEYAYDELRLRAIAETPHMREITRQYQLR